MSIEILIVGVIFLYVMNYTGRISANRFIADNEVYFRKLKEDDWDFFVRAKYGDGVNGDILFNKRIRNGLITIVVLIFCFISKLNYVTILFCFIGGFLVFKLDYFNIKKYYKAHLHEINSMLPHYLKSLEILIQHYTIPVAIGKSINDAPVIFREGLQDLINEINAGS